MSQDSTELHGQTPFAEFSWQVHSLCKSVWPRASDEVQIDYIKGGTFNRILGLSFNDLAISDNALLEKNLTSMVDGFEKEHRPSNIDDSVVESSNSFGKESQAVHIEFAKDDDPALKEISPPNSTASNESSQGKLISPPSSSSSSYSTDEDEPPFYLPPEPVGQRFVLRIPRDPDESIADYVATVEYLNLRTTLPIPKISHYDLTSDNSIGSPYSIQYRCPGMPLNLIYRQLSFHQQFMVADEVGRILCEIQAVQSPVAGQIGHATTEDGEARKLDMELLSSHTNRLWSKKRLNVESSPEANFNILHYGWNWRLKDYDTFYGKVSTLEGIDTLGIILFQFARHITAEFFRNSVNLNEPRGYLCTELPHLIAIAREMFELDCFNGDNTMVLCHGDFQAQNLMATIENDENGTVKIEAVLDWDNAIFAPYFMSSLPPRWLWSDDDESPQDEPPSYEDPADQDRRMLKYRFDRSAGLKWENYAYEPQWRLARKLFALALTGFQYAADYSDADALIAEWEMLRPVLLREQEEKRKKWEEEEKEKEEEEKEKEEKEMVMKMVMKMVMGIGDLEIAE